MALWKSLLVVAAVAFLLGACAPRAQKAEERAQSEPQPTATPTVPTEKPQDGELVQLWNDPPTLDPHLTTDATSAAIIVEVFGGLVTINRDLDVVPDLAEDWEVSQDGLTYTFFLRQDARFHDGEPVTAHDVKWSLERAADPRTAAPGVDQYLGDIVGVKAKLRREVTEVSGIEVLDDYTLRITIDAPKAYFIAKLTYPAAFVLDQENVESGGRNWPRSPNATGPFKLAEYVPGERLVLERNKFYHLGPPYLNRVRFLLAGGTAMLMYENDEIDVTGVGLADLDRVLNPEHPLYKELVKAPPSFSTSYIGLNVTQPPLDDVRVRQALNYAIDKSQIAELVLAELVVPAQGVLPPGFPAYNSNLTSYQYDPQKARQLLRQSKYGDDPENLPRLVITTAGAFGSAPPLDLEVILEMWRQNLGITVEVQQVEWATFLQDLQRRRFQMFSLAWIADYLDPENFLDMLFYSESSNNHTGYSNREVDALLEQARVESNGATRTGLYQQVEQMILDDAPWVPLWYQGERYRLIKPEVKDYFVAPLVIPYLRYIYIERP